MQVDSSTPKKEKLRSIKIVQVMLVKDSGNYYRTKPIRGQADAASIVKEFLAGEDREVFLAINLDNSNKINSINVVAIGTLDMTLVHPREIFKTAILSNSNGIIIAHNHPSGNPNPSEDDIKLTRQLFECGKLLGIRIFDHIILGEDEYASIRLEGKDILTAIEKFKN